jgi:hypothetical protein
MKRKGKNSKGEKAHHENPLPGEISSDQKEQNTNALQQADKDMNNDAEFTAHSKNDDLDEGETARSGEAENDLI